MLPRRPFPHTRLRRLRQAPWLRELSAEYTLTPQDLIWPLFVTENKRLEPIAALPGQYRHSLADCLRMVEKACTLGLPAVAIFPCVSPSKKDKNGTEALNPNNLINQVLRALTQEQFPIGLIADVALDPYTEHGHDGLIDDNGAVDNDATLNVLAQQALLHAESGASVLAPSDMMDGRVGRIRSFLDDHGYKHAAVLAYTAKYASHFYGPFRSAIGASKLQENRAYNTPSDKSSYQMHPNRLDDALHAAFQHAEEGADLLMVKPAMPYLDVLKELCSQTRMPVCAYQVSGEYAMLKHLAQGDSSRESALFYESLIACKRAGACSILSYYALEMAEYLRDTRA